MAATEIKRGEFVFRDTLFIDLGPTKRHTRASESELRALLLPSSSSNSSTKDQVAHYYEAQLLHYGLNRTKDKNLAKVRLTQALNSGALIVPPWVAEMEKGMRKEWMAAVKRSGKVGDVKNAAAAAAGSVGKKRKADGDATDVGGSSVAGPRKIKVMVEVDLPDGGHATAASPTKTAKARKQKVESGAVGKGKAPKATASKLNAMKTKPKPTPKPKPKPKAETSMTKSSAAASATAMKSTSKKPSNPVTTKASTASNKTRYNPADYHLTNYEYPDSASDTDTDTEDGPPPPYEAHDFNMGASTDDDHPRHIPAERNNRGGAAIQVSGTYLFTASGASIQDWEEGELIMRLDKSTRNPTLWGILHIDSSIRCVFTSTAASVNNDDDDDSDCSSQSISAFLRGSKGRVAWRTHDLETGDAMFRRECTGEIGFDGEGAVEGVFWDMLAGEDVCLEGRLVGDGNGRGSGHGHGHGPDWELEHIKDEWTAIPRRAYGRR